MTSRWILMNRAYLLVIVITFIAGCKKGDTKSFTIDNSSNAKDLNVAIYRSASDYMNSSNAVVTGIAKVNGSFSFPESRLSQGVTYYIDVFSSDYQYTNWVSDNNAIIGRPGETPRQFTFTGNSDQYSITYITSSLTTARVSLINGNAASTHWKAVDALDLVDGSSIWFSLPAGQKFAAIVVNKDATGIFSYFSGTDTVTTSFSFGDIAGYPVYSVIPNERYLNFFITNTSVNPNLFTYEPPTIDSVLALINGNLYILARQ